MGKELKFLLGSKTGNKKREIAAEFWTLKYFRTNCTDAWFAYDFKLNER